MVDSADEPPLSQRLHLPWARNKKSRAGRDQPDSNNTTEKASQNAGHNSPTAAAGSASTEQPLKHQKTERQNSSVVDKKGDGTETATIGTTETKASLFSRFIRDVKRILFSSWINWLLVTVPVGIILGALNDWAHLHVVSPSVVFAINAVAIIPLASMLAYATESVASKMGDTVGALLNVTFGNAVELIIFIIALVENEVRVVQAAAIGSILSNLLLILGMCFVVGGLRFREQVSYVYHFTQTLLTSPAVQCYCLTDECMPSLFERHQFGSTHRISRIIPRSSRRQSCRSSGLTRHEYCAPASVWVVPFVLIEIARLHVCEHSTTHY